MSDRAQTAKSRNMDLTGIGAITEHIQGGHGSDMALTGVGQKSGSRGKRYWKKGGNGGTAARVTGQDYDAISIQKNNDFKCH